MFFSEVRDLASDIVKHWLAIVKGTTPPMIKNNMSTNETGVQNQQSTANHEIKREVNQNDASQTDNLSHDTPIEDEADATYVQSTSPSSSSVDTDDSDVYVPPNQKDNAKSKKRVVAKKEKSLLKKSNRETKPKLKSKLITSNDSKEAKPGSIKLKIEKRIEEVPVLKTKKEEKTLEEKLKEKRKLKDEKEKEKFARFKEHREKREKHKDKQDLDGKNKNKLQEQKLKGDLSKLLPKSLEKLGRIPKISKDSMSQDDKRKDDAKKNEKVEDKKLVKKDDKLVVVKTKENEKDKDATKKDKDIKRPAPVLPKKPVSMSVEKRFAAGEAKPKTVKAYNSKFRLTGLEQEVIPKPVSRKTSLSGSPTLNLASTVAEKTAVKRSPPKDVEIEPIEKKLKSPDLSFTEEKSPQANKAKKRKCFIFIYNLIDSMQIYCRYYNILFPKFTYSLYLLLRYEPYKIIEVIVFLISMVLRSAKGHYFAFFFSENHRMYIEVMCTSYLLIYNRFETHFLIMNEVSSLCNISKNLGYVNVSWI